MSNRFQQSGLTEAHLAVAEDKLNDMCDRAEREGEGELARCIDRLSKLLASVLRDERWNELSGADERALAEALLHGRRAAHRLDAALCVQDRVLLANNGKVLDVRLGRDLRDAQHDIESAFDTGEAPRRGFVYIAWRKTPERYLYVGKATSTDRLNLAGHGKLARATADATLLSLLFPTQSREEILLGLEASIIELIECRTGQLPELNDRREKVPGGSGAKRLHELSDFLWRIADDLKKSF